VIRNPWGVPAQIADLALERLLRGVKDALWGGPHRPMTLTRLCDLHGVFEALLRPHNRVHRRLQRLQLAAHPSVNIPHLGLELLHLLVSHLQCAEGRVARALLHPVSLLHQSPRPAEQDSQPTRLRNGKQETGSVYALGEGASSERVDLGGDARGGY
jgi:hypothetical protein